MTSCKSPTPTVSWASLENSHAFGFWSHLVQSGHESIETSSTRVLVNGELAREIRHHQGLHQGDPLSHMFFILVMGVLNSLFAKVGELELLTPLVRRNPIQRISLYADDVAPFIWPTEPETNLSMEILAKFGEASGLQTNLQKSCVIPIRCEESELETVTTTRPCPMSGFPCTYLGLPISNSKLKKVDLLLWIEKVRDKLPGWKATSHEHGLGLLCPLSHAYLCIDCHQRSQMVYSCN